MLVVLYVVINQKGKAYHVWDVFLSHVLLGRTVVFGLCTKKPIKPKNFLLKNLGFFQPWHYVPKTHRNSRVYGDVL